MFSQTTPKPDSTFVIENRNDEPENAYCTGQLNPKTPKVVFKDGQGFEVIQETVTVLCDENNNDDSCISDSMKLLIKAKEPENGQGTDGLIKERYQRATSGGYGNLFMEK